MESTQANVSAAQVDRTAALFSDIAKESVAVEFIGGAVYGYCSELGALRLFHKYNSPKARARYSENLKTWYFSLERGF